LDFNGVAVDGLNRRDSILEDNASLVAAIDGNAVDLSVDPDNSVVAPVDVDGLLGLGLVDFDVLVSILELNDPLVTLEFELGSSLPGGSLASRSSGCFFGAAATAAAGTTLVARSSGFLCVIWDFSTFLSPEVMASPLFKAAKRALASGLAAPPEGGSAPAGGGAGADGGLGAAGAAGAAELASPPLGFQVSSVVWCFLM